MIHLTMDYFCLSSTMDYLLSIIYGVGACLCYCANARDIVNSDRHLSSTMCFPSLFAFGDSKTDTGNKQAYFPYESRSERLPYGSTFFGRPSDRFCDGRLTIDFQAQAYGLTLLSPYARGLGSDFQHGANFAVSGSGCIPGVADSAFHLTRQLNQFKKFRASYEDKFVRGEI
ncbi:hypothetical protein KP509_16G018800 [Ceratopteris richardii]|uniref:GDSL esterase/lipase n=1 Tax=Ceratopteris richardii TaxID=49495 RepID=A0A8T2SYI8_CERRI|nr:hypothetical protein KP509_16G018800 [Ceratopteris richardii]